jgi:hypothetical protein
MAHNASGLLLCWYFIFVRQQPKPIKDFYLKLRTNAEKNYVRLILAEIFTNADCYSVAPA